MRDSRLANPDTEQPVPPDAIERSRILGRDVALADPDDELLERAHMELAHAGPEPWRAFYDGFATAVGGDENRCRIWIAVLEGAVQKALKDPASLLFSPSKHDVRHFQAQIAGWAEEWDPLVVWGHRGYVNFRGKHPFYELSLLQTLDPAAWCRVVDALPSLDLMEGALVYYANLTAERAVLEKLLALAPLVFGADGRWLQSRSVLALILTRWIIRHVGAVHKTLSYGLRTLEWRNDPAQDVAKHDLAHIESVELPTWLRRVFTILLERVDGKHIAIRFLGYLAYGQLVGERHQAVETSWAEKKAFQLLAEVLGATGLGVRDLRDTWEAVEDVAKRKADREKGRRLIPAKHPHREEESRGEGAPMLRGRGLPLLYGAAVMLGNGQGVSTDVEAFWTWFEELLRGRDPGFSLAESGPAMVQVSERFGLLLSRLFHSAAVLQKTYIALEPQRRQGGFQFRYRDYTYQRESVLLLRIGLDAVEKLAGDAVVGEPEAVRLFWWIFDAARRLWLTSVRDMDRRAQTLVCTCFAFMPKLFRGSLHDALSRALPHIANDPWMVSAAGWLLWANGTEPERLVRMMADAGADLVCSLEDAYQWAKLTQTEAQHHTPRQYPEFIAGFQALADTLGLKFEAPASHEADP